MSKRQVAAPHHHWASGPVYRTDLHFAAPNHSDDRGDATAFRKRVSGRRAFHGREPNFSATSLATASLERVGFRIAWRVRRPNASP